MITKWRWVILGGGLGLYLAGVGFLGAAVLNQHDVVVRNFRSYLVPLELKPPAGLGSSDTSWAVRVRNVDEAPAEKNIDAAGRARHEAFVAALRSRR